MSAFTQLRSTEIKPGTAVAALTILLVVVIGATLLIVKTFTGSGSQSLVADPKATKTVASPAAGVARILSASSPAADSWIVERNLFRPSPAQMAAAMHAATGAASQLPAGGHAATGEGHAGPPGSRGNSGPDLYCTGIVKVGGDSYALIESARLGVGQYLPVGGSAYGCQVTEIGEDYAVVQIQGKTERLNIQNSKPEAVAGPAAGALTGGAAAGPALTGPAGAMPYPAAGGFPPGQFPPGGYPNFGGFGRRSRGGRTGGGGVPPNFGNFQRPNGG